MFYCLSLWSVVVSFVYTLVKISIGVYTPAVSVMASPQS